VLVAALKSGTKAAVIEFVSANPQPPQAIMQMVNFIDGCRLANAQVLVPGNPPLTVYDVEENLDVLEWLLDAPLAPGTRAAVRSQIMDEWRMKDADTIAQVRQILAFRDEVFKLPPARQNAVRRENELALVEGLRADTGRASTLLLAAYESAHPPIAVGTPALTRQEADAAIDLFYFMAGELEGVQAAPNDAAKAAWARELARSWATLPSETRKAVAGMPATWALTVAVWPEMPPAMREQVKGTYAQMDVVKALRSNFAAARAQAAASAEAQTRSQNTNAVNVSDQISRMNQSYQATSSMLTTQYNATISMMAGIGNMSGPRYTVR
jgi:hypothetical protein